MQYSLIALLLTGAAVASPMALEERSGSKPPLCHSISPAPKGSICNKKGSLSKAAVLSKPDAYGADSCANVCGGTAACMSWSYNTNTDSEVCTLYKKTLSAQGFKASASSTVLYADKKCEKCVPCTQNGFTNGDFDDNTTTGWTCTSDTDSSGYSCSASNQEAVVVANVATDEYSDVQFIQGFNVCNGYTYQVSFDYAVNSTNPENALSVSVPSGQIFQKQDNWAPAGQFTTFSTTYTQSRDNSGFINFDWLNFAYDSSAPLLLDNISITRVS